MPGSVRHNAPWYRLANGGGERIEASSVTPGDCIRLRGLTRLEIIDLRNMLPEGASVDNLNSLPSDVIAFILEQGIEEWTFLDDEGEPLSYTEKRYVDDETFDFVLPVIIAASMREPGNANGSENTPSQPGRIRRSSPKP